MKLFITDLETTGLDKKKCAIIEIGIICVDRKLQEVGRLHLFVRPFKKALISSEALKVNNIKLDSEFKKSAFPLQGAMELVRDFVIKCIHDEPAHLGGWNGHFDYDFLNVNFLRAGVFWPFHYRILDVQSIVAYENDFEFHSLKEVFPHNAHRSIEDCEATVEVLRNYRNSW